MEQTLCEHYSLIKRYRARAFQHAVLGMSQPEYYISMAQDGTDQMGFGYPKVPEFTKAEDNYRLKTKVMVSMIHGKELFYYVCPENVSGDPNTAIECIQRSLKQYEADGTRLPRTFFFQADNCPRESKNTYQLAYFGWLVELSTLFSHRHRVFTTTIFTSVIPSLV